MFKNCRHVFELVRILEQEGMLWRTESRIQRIGEEERNTSVLHRSFVIKRHVSHILQLRDDVGNEVTEPENIWS